MINLEIKMEWHQWKSLLGKAVHVADFLGISDNNIESLAYRVGQVLANNVDPGNREQRLLKELWEQGDQSEKRMLAALLTRVVDHDTGCEDLDTKG